MTKTFKTHFNFALLWSSLVLGGALVGFSLGAFLVRDFDDREYALAVFLIIFVFGLFIGTGQWLALMIRLRNIWWWIPATAIGYSVGGFGFFFILAMLGQAFLGFDELYGGAYPWIQVTLTLLLTGMVTGLFSGSL